MRSGDRTSARAGVRRKLLAKSPYAIAFIEQAMFVRVISVLHGAPMPDLLATADLTDTQSANQWCKLLESHGFMKPAYGEVEVIDAVVLRTLGAVTP